MFLKHSTLQKWLTFALKHQNLLHRQKYIALCRNDHDVFTIFSLQYGALRPYLYLSFFKISFIQKVKPL